MKRSIEFKSWEAGTKRDHPQNDVEMRDLASRPRPRSPRYSMDSKGERSISRLIPHNGNCHHEDNSKPEETFRQTLQSFPWHLFSVLMTLPIALSPIIILATAAEEASVRYISGRDCYPNGMWKERQGATWRIMDSSYFFTPNLSFGAMTFTQVKVIDIAWDLVVGRGGQVLLAYANYRIFNEWLLYHLEMHLTSYKMYTAVAFQTTTMSTLGVLGKEFLSFGKGTWRRFFRWLAMFCMLISTLYVLAFPTLMATMTGYISTYGTYIENNEKNLIDYKKMSVVRYVVQNASRINPEYRKDLVVTENDKSLIADVEEYLKNYVSEDTWKPPRIDSTPFEPNIHEYLNQNRTSKFGGKVISKPTLSIIATHRGVAPKIVSPGLREMWYSLSDDGGSESGRQGDYYNASYILSHGSCKPSETYQWGFSYIFLFMVSIFNFIWSCIMVGMWFDTTRRSRMYKAGRRPGLLRSIMDISAAIREELGNQVDTMSEDEIRNGLRDSEGKLLVPKNELRITRTDGREPAESTRKRSWRTDLTKGSTF